MLKALKWIAILLVGGFVALLALGMMIEANKSPEEKVADATRRAAEKEAAAAEAAEPEEAPQVKPEPVEEPPQEPTEDVSDTQVAEGEAGGSRVQSLVDKFKSITADAEWQFNKQDSPFDGPVYEASKVFESDTYAAEMAIQLRCVQAKKLLSLVFISHVYDSSGNTLPSSAFGNTWDISGQPFAAQGRVKWANRQPDNFTAMLGEHSNVAALDTGKIVEAAGVNGASPSAALKSLLPAYFELSNGAGNFTLSVPANSPSISKVLAACE